MYKVAA